MAGRRATVYWCTTWGRGARSVTAHIRSSAPHYSSRIMRWNDLVSPRPSLRPDDAPGSEGRATRTRGASRPGGCIPCCLTSGEGALDVDVVFQGRVSSTRLVTAAAPAEAHGGLIQLAA